MFASVSDAKEVDHLKDVLQMQEMIMHQHRPFYIKCGIHSNNIDTRRGPNQLADHDDVRHNIQHKMS
jgi:hypothetical protein